MSLGDSLAQLLPSIIALIAVVIAAQNATTNRRQYRLALFDRRMKVFDSTMKLLAAIAQSARTEFDDLTKFLRETRDHEFLFGPEVGERINQIYSKGVELRTRGTIIRAGIHTDAERRAAIEKEAELLEWFAAEMGKTRTAFLPYMDFRKS